MNRIWALLKWGREKLSIKLVLVALVLGTGAVTTYLGYSRFSGEPKLPEPKKITTGGGALPGAELASGAMPVSAEAPLYDPNASQQPPPAPQPYTFNPNAFGPQPGAPPTTPPAENSAPAYGDPGAGGQPAPYQPLVAGNGPGYSPDPSQPPAEGAPAPLNPYGPQSGEVPPNPIRGNTASLNDEHPAEPNAEQPRPLAEPPLENARPLAAAPLVPFSAETAAPPTPRPPSNYGQPAVAAPRDVAAREAAGHGTPGDRQFEGAQTPALTLEKIAPAEIQVGKLAMFELRVKNVGQIAAQQVQVTDHIPRGTQLVEARPQFQKAADGSLVWPLGTMQPGDEQVVQMQVMPQTEGEIGSVAQVTFAASATARSVCTRPLLTIEHSAPKKLLIGESLTMTIVVTNPGTGAATGVVVEEDVPPGLIHVSGAELEYEIGTLRPGESKPMELTLRADKAGIIKNTIVVRGDGNLAAQHQINIEVVAPQLQVGIVGPKKRFLERPATYTVPVSNPGTAAARDVELVAYLPRGMKFVETDAHGQYDPQQHAVFWTLEELPATKNGTVKLTAMPMETGDQKLRIEGRADLGLTTAFEQVISVDASAELIHTIADLSDPIEVGSDTTYEVRVTNVGTKSATNIRIAALLPPELKVLSGEGPTRAANDGSRVIFEPLARLNPGEEAIFRVQANAQKAGDFIVRVQISSNEWPNPVTREESTRVYSDQ